MFRTSLPRATYYNFELKPSRNINAVTLSDRQNFFRSHFLDRFYFTKANSNGNRSKYLFKTAL